MTLDEHKELIEKLTLAGIEISEAKKEIDILNKEVKDFNEIKKIVNERIKTRKPLQYILGKAYFLDFNVEVNENVLIPRPETEILIEHTIQKFGLDSKFKILDIGTGSGIIAIALAKSLSSCEITAIDLNKEIIELARKNAFTNNIKNINFKICNIFSKCFEGLIHQNNFDLIISNPPYVKENLLETLLPEVLHEPKIALSGSEENTSGLIYYEKILEVCKNTKLIAFEIDPTLVGGLTDLLNKNKITNFKIYKDYSKLDRFLFINF